MSDNNVIGSYIDNNRRYLSDALRPEKLPEFITFTGLDDKTDLKHADYLAQIYPIEWGILSSPNRS